jgi:hypothetical protein
MRNDASAFTKGKNKIFTEGVLEPLPTKSTDQSLARKESQIFPVTERRTRSQRLESNEEVEILNDDDPRDQ